MNQELFERVASPPLGDLIDLVRVPGIVNQLLLRVRVLVALLMLLIDSHLTEVEQVRAKLRDVELHFPREVLVEAVEVFEHLLLVFTGVQGENDRENLILFVCQVGIEFAALTTKLLRLALDEGPDFAPALLPVVLVYDLVHQSFQISVCNTLSLLLHLDVLGVVLS